MLKPRYQAESTTVMILAAGHGKRMLPLTEHTPKPLLKVGDLSLIEHHLIKLAAAGFKNIVINHAHLGDQIVFALGNGDKYRLSIEYSDEASIGPLETAGGIIRALPLINSDPFMVINGDIFTDFDFSELLSPLDGLGRLVMVRNPAQHPDGDFAVDEHSILSLEGENKRTFAGIALYRKSFFNDLPSGSLALAPPLKKAIKAQQLEAVCFDGQWHDIGTPQRLAEINAALRPKQ